MKLPPMQGSEERSDHIDSIVRNFILHCKKFLQLERVTTKSHDRTLSLR